MSGGSRRSLSVLAVLTALGSAWLGPPSAAHAQRPLGEEFRVNSYTTETQDRPAVAAQPDGSFVVVWNSRDQDGDDWGVFGQRYDADANPLGGEFQVNTYTTGRQIGDAVAADADGNFVVVWFSDGPAGARIAGQRYDAAGNPLGGEFLVSSYRPQDPAVAADADGDFVVVWSVGFAIFGRRLEASGNPIGGDFQVSQSTFRDLHYSPVVAANESGEFVVAWTAAKYYQIPRPLYQEVFARRYDSSGNALGNEFQVNTFTANFQGYSDIVMDPDGAFLIVWESYPYCTNDDEEECAPAGLSALDHGINGQRFDTEGQPAGGEFQIAPFGGGYDAEPSVARRTGDDYVAVWNDPRYPSLPPQDVYGRVFTETGALVGLEFTVNSYSTGRQHLADVVPLTDGDFVVLWQGSGSGDTSGIFGQRITMSALTLRMTGGGCPGQATATISNAPPNSEIALVRAANQNGFVKGGALCNGTQFEIGEPFQLPPVFVITDANGVGSTQLEFSFNRCYVQALALQSCETSNTSRVR